MQTLIIQEKELNRKRDPVIYKIHIYENFLAHYRVLLYDPSRSIQQRLKRN